MCGRQHVSYQLYTLASQFRGNPGHAGDVTARPGEAFDKPGFDRVSNERHDNRNIARRLLRSLCCRREPSHNYIDFETHQLGG